VDQTALAANLEAKGYRVNIRHSVGGGTGAEGMNNLSHSFLRCNVRGAEEVFIIDTRFRDQFDIHHATSAYREILNTIPLLLVASEDKITPLVQVRQRQFNRF